MFDKICLFDMDGTLADYDKAMRESLVKINPKNIVLPNDLFNTDEYLELQIGTKNIMTFSSFENTIKYIDTNKIKIDQELERAKFEHSKKIVLLLKEMQHEKTFRRYNFLCS